MVTTIGNLYWRGKYTNRRRSLGGEETSRRKLSRGEVQETHEKEKCGNIEEIEWLRGKNHDKETIWVEDDYNK